MAEEANITPDETVRENLETILSSINDGFFVLDRQWRYTYINNRQTEIIGMRREDVLGKNIWDLFPDTIDTELYIQLHQAQAERTSVRCEYFYPACNRWFENRVHPLENGIAIFCTEITERKQAEEALRESEQRFQAFMNYSPASAWIADRDGRLLYLSPTYFRMFQFPQQDAVGKNIIDIYPAEFAQQFIDNNQQVFQTKQVFETIESAPRPDGSIGEFLVYKFPMLGGNGDTLIGGVAVDITEGMRTETALKESEERFRTIFEKSPIGVSIIDVNGRFVQANKTYCEMLGYNEGELRQLTFANVTHPEDVEAESSYIRQLFNREISNYKIEKRYLNKNGQIVWVNLTGTAVFNSQGELLYGFAMVENITCRKQTEAALRESQELFHSFMNHSPIAAFIKDETGRYIYANSWVERVYQRQKSELLGQTDFELLPVEIAQQFRANDVTVLTSAQPLHILEKIQHEDGEHYYMSFKFPVSNASGGKLLAGVAIDVTDRIRAEEALRQREQELASIADAVPALIAYVDTEKRYRFNNRSYEQWFAIPPSEIYGKHLWEIMGESAYEKICPYVEQALSGQSVSFQNQVPFQNIGTRSVSVNYIPQFDRHGNVEGFVALVNDITDRIQVEEALRTSDERFRLAARAVNGVVYDWDIQSGTVYRSEGLYDLVGIHPEQVPQRRDWWLERIHPEDGLRIQQMMLSILAAHSDRYESEYRIRHEDGRWIDVWDRGYLIHDRNGELIRVVGSTVDITERKQAEAEKQQLLAQIRTERELLAAVLQQMPAGVMVADAASGNIILSNQQIAQIWRIPSLSPVDNIDRSDLYRIFHPDGRPYQPDEWPLSRSIKTGEVAIEEEIAFVRGDDTQGIMLVNSAPIRDSQGNIKAGVVTFYDISDRKRVEQALREREQRFTTLFNGMEDWVLVYHLTADNRPGQLIEVNEQACQKLGYSRDELLAMSVTDIISSDAIDPKVSVQNLLRQKHIVVESLHVTKNGQTIPVEVSATLFTLNNLPTVQAICRDISKRKQAEKERDRLLERERAAREEAEAANRIKDEFLAVLSHELRSPLNPILGWARLLQKRKFDDETTTRALETIERNAKLQTQLIEDLLDVSRILRGKLVLNVAAVNLVSTIAAALETVQLAAEAKGIQIQTFLSANAGQVSGDATRLQQVVWNLLSNAVKFTPAGGRIQVCLQQDGNYAQITVSDTGKGISREFLPYVFEYFRQEDGKITRKFGGLGLGLAIVRHITELHGGTVSVESPGEGLGATFIVRLPLYKQLDSTIDDKQGVSSSLTLDPSPLAKLRILVVDDEADMRELLRVILEQSGAEVRLAASAVEVLTILPQYNPDVLISDIGMPETDGYMLIRQVRALPPDRGGEIPAIALTAYAGELNRQQALEAGFGRHISKPVEPEELVQAIAELSLGLGFRG